MRSPQSVLGRLALAATWAVGLACTTVPATAATIQELDLVPHADLPLEDADTDFYQSGVDRKRGYMYMTVYADPVVVVKVRMATPTAPAARVGSATLGPGDLAPYYHRSLKVDEESGHIYLVLYTTPGRVAKLKVGEGDAPPEYLGSLTLDAGDDEPVGLDIDPVGGFGYVTTDTDPFRVVKFALGDGDALPTRVGAFTANAGENSSDGVVIDPAVGKGWACTNSATPEVLVQFNLGAGSAPPSRESALVLPPQDLYPINGYFDALNQIVYFVGEYNSFGSSQAIKFDVSGPTPRRLADYIGLPDEDEVSDFAPDFANGMGFLVTYTGYVVKVANGGRFGGLGRISSVDVPPSPIPSGAIYDPVHGFLHVYPYSDLPSVLRIYRQPFPDGRPDLTAAVSKTAKSGKPGKFRVAAQAEVANIANTGAGLFHVRFFLSSDRVLSHDDVQIGKDRLVRSLKAGKARRVAASGAVAADPAGKHIIVTVDPYDLTGDANRGSNTAISDAL